MTNAQKKRVEAHAATLKAEGKNYQELENFASWYSTTFGGQMRTADQPRTVNFISDRWHLYEKAVSNGFIAGQNSTQNSTQGFGNKNSGANAHYNDIYDVSKEFKQAETTFESNAEAIGLYEMEDERYERFRANFLAMYPHRSEEVVAYERRISQ